MTENRAQFDSVEMSLRGRIGAHAQHARHDPRETTVAARVAFLRRFEDEVDLDRILPDDERLRRAEHACKAHMARLALASNRAQAERRAARS